MWHCALIRWAHVGLIPEAEPHCRVGDSMMAWLATLVVAGVVVWVVRKVAGPDQHRWTEEDEIEYMRAVKEHREGGGNSEVKS